MDSLRDKAKAGVEATRATDAEGVWTVQSAALYEADEISPEGDYPKYGEWLEVAPETADEAYLECPRGLAAFLVESLSDDPDWPVTLEIDHVNRTEDGGEFRFTGTVEE